MKYVFRKVTGEIVDVVKHTTEILKENPSVEIHIGSDSQNGRRKTVYDVVIAYRYGFRGVHYIHSRMQVKKIRDIYDRLFQEAVISIEVATWLKEQMPSIQIQIDMDYNGDERHISNKLIGSTKGWAESLGFSVNVKPDNQIATRAADHECR